MLYLAGIIGDALWGSCLWLVRRRWMRRMQAVSVGLAPEGWQRGIRASIRKQNRFARRIGRILMRSLALVLIGSVLVTLLARLALFLIEKGYLPTGTR